MTVKLVAAWQGISFKFLDIGVRLCVQKCSYACNWSEIYKFFRMNYNTHRLIRNTDTVFQHTNYHILHYKLVLSIWKKLETHRVGKVFTMLDWKVAQDVNSRCHQDRSTNASIVWYSYSSKFKVNVKDIMSHNDVINALNILNTCDLFKVLKKTFILKPVMSIVNFKW